MRKFAYLTAAAVLAAAAGAAQSFAAEVCCLTLVVGATPGGTPAVCDRNNPDDSLLFYTTIQKAIDDYSSSDNVVVCPGTYPEDLTISTHNAGMSLVGIGNPTILGVATDAAANFPNAVPNIDIQTNSVTMAGFNIVSPAANGSNYSSGIVLAGRNIKIANNNFTVSCGNPVSVAIQTWRNENAFSGARSIDGLVISDNTFANAACPAGGYGYEAIFVNNQSNEVLAGNPVKILSNSISGSLRRGVGIERANVEVRGNTIRTALTPAAQSAAGIPAQGIKVFESFNVPLDHLVTSVLVADNHVGRSGDGRFTNGIVVLSNGNQVLDNRVVKALTGIEIDGQNNRVAGNEVENSKIVDCLDTTGATAASVLNTWTDNEGFKSSPRRLCKPESNFFGQRKHFHTFKFFHERRGHFDNDED